MPILPTFSAPRSENPISGGRRASAEDLYAGVGELGKTVSAAAGSFLSNVEENESRQALIQSTEIRAKYARELDAATLNGGDLGALKERMATDLAKVGEKFQTVRGQDSLALYTANSELMYDEQANRIAVARASADAVAAGQKFLNSTGAILQSNPLYLATAEKDAEALAATFNVSPEKRAEITRGLKSELNAAAVAASARINPEETKKALEAGKWDLSPDQRKQGIAQADTEIRAKRADQAYQNAEYDRRVKEADSKARDKHFGEIVSGTATRRKIMADPDLQPATREHMIFLMDRHARELRGELKASDPTVMRDLWTRIHLPDTDPRKIFDSSEIVGAVQKGLLNTSDANSLNTLVANMRDENGKTIGSKLSGQMNIFGGALSRDPKYIGRPALVAEIQMDYQARVFDKVSQYRNEKKNPNDLFNPANKDWVGSREFQQGAIDAAEARARATVPTAIRVTTQAEYDALEPGTAYIDSKGNQAVKTGKAKKSDPAAAVSDAAKSYYQMNKEAMDNDAEGTARFDQSVDMLIGIFKGERPTREAPLDYSRRKTGQQ